MHSQKGYKLISLIYRKPSVLNSKSDSEQMLERIFNFKHFLAHQGRKRTCFPHIATTRPDFKDTACTAIVMKRGWGEGSMEGVSGLAVSVSLTLQDLILSVLFSEFLKLPS